MIRSLLLLGCALAAAVPAHADITIGALVSLTGPSASLGIPARNTIALLPTDIAGQPVRWVILDDASDPASAVKAARKLVDQEKVDVIIGPSNTPSSVAVLDVAAETSTPFLSLSGSNAVIEPAQGARRWGFKMFPAERLATGQMAAHMKRTGIASLGLLGFATGLGDGYFAAMRADAAAQSVQVVGEARYNPDDTSVTGQVLRLMQARPAAIFIAASGTPATTPIIELRNRGYTGAIYTVMGIAGPDAIRVGGKALDGVMLSGVPVLTAEQLPEAAPSRAPALAFIAAYEGKFGARSRNLFAATFWDAFLLIDAATKPALAAGSPGSAAFRTGLRDAMEHVQGLAGAEGVFSLSPTDHSGAEPSSQVMIELRDGGYRLMP
jgi:branched-chain amino acid transport system substrate-binding protein